MAKMTKAQARKRLAEAATKCAKVFVDGDIHMTNAELKQLLDCRNKLLNMSKKLK